MDQHKFVQKVCYKSILDLFQINYIGEIVHELTGNDLGQDFNRTCLHHQKSLQLTLKRQPKPTAGNDPEQIQLEESPLKLVYKPDIRISGTGKGFSEKFVLTISECCVKSLIKITALLAIEGRVSKQIFEPDPEIEMTFAWTGSDVYGQDVFGEASAVLKLGFDFDDCEQKIWESRVVNFEARDPHLDDFAGWTLNVHHRFEPRSGILYFGDGGKVDLKQEGPSLRTIHTLYQQSSGSKPNPFKNKNNMLEAIGPVKVC